MNIEACGGCAVGLAILLFACGPGPQGNPAPVDGAGPTVDAAVPDAADGHADFPADPILEPGVPPDAPELFEEPGAATGGPCLIEPELGALFPRDWLRPRFRYQPGPRQNLFQIRLSAASQVHDLVVYTTSTAWTMPASLWTQLNLHTVDEPIVVTVRGAVHDGSGLEAAAMTGSTGSFTIAPVAAAGSIVYWTSGPGDSTGELKGFAVGEETVHPVLAPGQAGVGCIGCHSSTPDGEFVAFSANLATSDGRPAYSDLRGLDGSAAQPGFLTAEARGLLARAYQHQPVFSAAHWQPGDRVAITTFETGGRTELIWTDLETDSPAEGAGWGVLARTGDTLSAAAPAFSHDGTRVAYARAPVVTSGMNLDTGRGDIYMIPYAGRQGGPAAPVAGASEASVSEHYPAFSADDQLLAFTRVPPTVGSYDHPQSEVYVVPASGGAAVRLAANDPPSCAGVTSPGVSNSWPKWSPEARSDGGRSYYWLTFSSRRDPSGRPQLFVTGLTVAGGAITTYPAIYFWNQPADENNHTPAWDNFAIVVD